MQVVERVMFSQCAYVPEIPKYSETPVNETKEGEAVSDNFFLLRLERLIQYYSIYLALSLQYLYMRIFERFKG